MDREGSGANQKLAGSSLFPHLGKKEGQYFPHNYRRIPDIGIITCLFGYGLNFEYLSGKTIPDKCKIV